MVVPGTGRCARHRRKKDIPRRDGWVYSDRRYGIWRRSVLLRDKVCRFPGCTEPATDSDHIVPIIDDGAPFDTANGQGLCSKHHKLKTKADRGRRKAKARRGGA